MLLKINISYQCDIDRAKEIISNIMETTEGVVKEPKPNAVVTDLTPDGVHISVYFWINTDKDKPMQVFDAVATRIKKGLSDGGIEMCPTTAAKA
jgi:small-conductance mechanosensitive channel